MMTVTCHVILVVDTWLQEILQRHQEHTLHFIGIRLGLEGVVYKSDNWAYQCISLKAENKIHKLRKQSKAVNYIGWVGKKEEEFAPDMNVIVPCEMGVVSPLPEAVSVRGL